MALENRAIGRRIAELREQAHLTQPVAAEKAGVSLRGYQKWEAGAARPNWANLERIATVFGVKPENIIGDPAMSRNGDTNDLEARLSALEADTAAIKTAVGQVLSNWQDELLPILGELHEFVEQQQAAQTSGAKRPSTGRRRRAS